MSARTAALLPAALLALLVFWCGTFQGAASAAGSIAHQVAVLLVCLWTPRLLDPLDLGSLGRLLPLALIALLAISWWASPVNRAGLIGLTLLPAYLLLPASAGRCWKDPRLRQIGLTSLSLLTLVVCLVALGRWQLLSLPRASLPLGHHNLLAGWLILMMPACLAAGLAPGMSRWLAGAGGATGLLTLAATGSLLGATALAAQALLAALWWPRLRVWLVPGLLAIAVLMGPRWLSILQSTDLSAQARASYLQAGWQGLLVRPGLGWGPGAVPWTVGEFMRPAEGIHPASQIVGDLHSLPLQVAYEIGCVGLFLSLAIAAIFLLRRGSEIRDARQAWPQRAALLGLFGASVFALGSAPLTVPALPATAAILAGMTLRYRTPVAAGRRLPYLLAYLLLAAAVLAPLDRAHVLYEQARLASTPTSSLQLLSRARRADPEFPLYLARYAWLAAAVNGIDQQSADLARQAAERAPGLAPLWLAAGDLGRRADRPWAREALATAQRLDPLSPLVAFHLLMERPDDDKALRLGEFALSAEPRLAAASWWWNHRDLADLIGQRLGTPVPIGRPSTSSDPVVLALTLDRNPALSFSLFAFRRSPWPARLAPVALLSDESTNPNTMHR